MSSPSAPSGTRQPAGPGAAGESFSYEGFEADPESGLLLLRYRLGGAAFLETIRLPAGRSWDGTAWQAARLIFLLAGVSYYKTAAPATVELGDTLLLPGEREFLRRFYLGGLGEFAHRNGLDLARLSIEGGVSAASPVQRASSSPRAALVPFGGGIDSIVTVELLRAAAVDQALFVLSPAGGRFEAIEAAAEVTGLAIVRAERALDPKVLVPREHGYLTGHVPVTGVLSAIAVLAAVLEGRHCVVMSNERSSSHGNVVTALGAINHQWSKGLEFEEEFRRVLARALGGSLDFFSLLRPCSELWIAERFAQLTAYHPAFRSCNRSFRLDPAGRLETWCGLCDKCCFIDLILAPFLGPGELRAVFGGNEPLENPALGGQFETLLGLSGDAKPWECVGDTDECASAAVMAAERPDRSGNDLLTLLVQRLGSTAEDARRAAASLLEASGPHHVPAGLLPEGVLPAPAAAPPRCAPDADIPADPLV